MTREGTVSTPPPAPTTDTAPPSAGRSVLAQYLALALTWGASFLFIKVALTGLSPAQTVLGRLALGALALNVIMLVTRRRWPRRPVFWAHMGVVALMLCVVPFLLFAWAGQYIPSGLSSIYNATTPLMTMLVTLAALRQERLGAAGVLGLLLGAAGVVVVLAPWNLDAETGPWWAQAACLGATFCYGLSFAYTRRFVLAYGHDAPTIAAAQVSLATLIMLALSPLLATGPVRLDLPVVASLAALGVLGTGLAYVWNTSVIASWGATTASTVTYLTPLVGVVLGVLVLGETLTWNQPVGAVIVVAGIMTGQGVIGSWSGRRSP
ncbi:MULTISPECIES: DMT family transporter [unclassified Streptosporangium]|uniref:DMT family transporter n=1 Tax=unclassified Streptosporangium TaxID=2632669 RepID=UPI002E2911AF|nr:MULTISPECIES: DMT family transporter [unclassified Streptosporangium]